MWKWAEKKLRKRVEKCGIGPKNMCLSTENNWKPIEKIEETDLNKLGN